MKPFGKHPKDGGSVKSPRVRHLMMLDAKKNDRKSRKKTCAFESINSLFNKR